MTKKRTMPKTKSRDKNETGDVSGTSSDAIETVKIVGVHILSKKDTEQHFGKPKPVGQKKENGETPKE